MPVLETCDIWTQFLECVKTKCSATAFGNWLAPIQVLEVSANEIKLEIPNIFVKEYLLSNFNKELCAFLPVHANGETSHYFQLGTLAKKNPTPISMPAIHEKKSEQVTNENKN